jgi:hypothetical protein
VRKDKYIQGLKRELAGRGARDPRVADAIIRELEASGERVETRKKPGRPKKQGD